MNDNDMPVAQRLALRKKAALKIDPKTAEVFWAYRQWFGDLPNATAAAPWEKHSSNLALPTELPFFGGER